MNDSIANTEVDSDSHCPSSLYRTFKHYIRLHSLVHHHLDDQPVHLTILFGLGVDHVLASVVAVFAMGMLEHFFRLAGGQSFCATPATTCTWGIIKPDFRFECLGPFSHRPNLAYVRYTRDCSRCAFDDQLCEKKTSNWRHAQYMSSSKCRPFAEAGSVKANVLYQSMQLFGARRRAVKSGL